MNAALADDFKLLSVETRLRIVCLLRENRSLCVNALAAHLKTPATLSALSQHLRLLKASGWVFSEKKGNWVHYSLNNEKFEAFKRETGKLLQEPSSSAAQCRHKKRRSEKCVPKRQSAGSRRT